MRLVRRILVAIAIAAFVAGAMPLALAFGCIPQVAAAATQCEHDGECPEAPQIGCVCIHYPAPQAPGTLAVLHAAAAAVAPAAMLRTEPAPAVALAARHEPPEPPPPR